MEKIIEKVTLKELAAILSDPKTVKGTSFVGFNALTEMKLNKTLGAKIPNPDFGRVFKRLSNQLAMVFSDKTTNAYENMVNRRLVLDGKEADFKVSKRSWGTRVEGTSFLHHTKADGTYDEYLFVIYHESPVKLAEYAEKELGITFNDEDRALLDSMSRPVVAYESKSGSTEYLKADAEGNLTPIAWDDIQGKPSSKDEGAQGGLSEGMKVIPRTFKLSSLQTLSMNGKTYLIDKV